MKRHKVRRARPSRLAAGTLGPLPVARIMPADQQHRFPKVWMVGSRDARHVGQGVGWEFDVILQFRSQDLNADHARTVCIFPPAHKNYQIPAIEMLRERARLDGYCKVEIFDIRPPLTLEKREYLRQANQAIKNLKPRPLGLVGAADCRSQK